jgi:AcrR family transcriptional regulator
MTTSSIVETRRAKGREREALIVAAAIEVIAERGLPYTRISDVAARAGMTPGHVSYYFPSKNDLLMRAIEESEAGLVDELLVTLSRVRGPWRRLDRLIELSVATGPGDPGWVLWFQVWLEGALDDAVARGHDALGARWRAVLGDVIDYGVQHGAFRPVVVDEVADVVSATIDGLSIQLTLGADGMSRARLLTLVRSTTRALLTP